LAHYIVKGEGKVERERAHCAVLKRGCGVEKEKMMGGRGEEWGWSWKASGSFVGEKK
jgi:hypothetical protein